jgi:hypothetical protein
MIALRRDRYGWKTPRERFESPPDAQPHDRTAGPALAYPLGMRATAALALSLFVVGGCNGDIGPTVLVAPDGVGEMGMRRLTVREYDNTLRDILLDTSRPGAALLPEDVRAPFDNDFQSQQPSAVLIEALETLATQAADRLAQDPARRTLVVGCQPTTANDTTCMDSFVRRLGRLALRRPLGDDEVGQYLELATTHAVEDNDFYAGVDAVVRALLQDAEFAYRIEIGTALPNQPGVYVLNGFEKATRLSFLIWGTTPDDPLLDLAAAGGLDTAADVETVAASMLADPRAREQIDRFHSMWLGYEALPHAPELTNAFRIETRALVERVIFDQRDSWLQIFRATESFMNDDLALHYGLPAPGSATPVWVDVSAQNRQGILSQGSFLSVAANPGDTSPTKRGKQIRNRLLCQDIPPPPPEVNADQPPSGGDGDCKIDRYAQHRSGACAACHDLMDPLGFGLENYDITGRYRTHDDGNPDCVIDGSGEIAGVGSFTGPAELSELLIESGDLTACLVHNLYQYAVGRQIHRDDRPLIEALGAAFAESEHRFDTLILRLVSHEAFGFRRDEEVSP